jgi:hypothetical protein
MSGHKPTGITLAEIQQITEWIKFILSEYFKWYAPFLTLNIAGIAYAATRGDNIDNVRHVYIPSIFIIINPVWELWHSFITPHK